MTCKCGETPCRCGPRPCACGCMRPVEPGRNWRRKYFNTLHKLHAYGRVGDKAKRCRVCRLPVERAVFMGRAPDLHPRCKKVLSQAKRRKWCARCRNPVASLQERMAAICEECQADVWRLKQAGAH